MSEKSISCLQCAQVFARSFPSGSTSKTGNFATVGVCPLSGFPLKSLRQAHLGVQMTNFKPPGGSLGIRQNKTSGFLWLAFQPTKFKLSKETNTPPVLPPVSGFPRPKKKSAGGSTVGPVSWHEKDVEGEDHGGHRHRHGQELSQADGSTDRRIHGSDVGAWVPLDLVPRKKGVLVGFPRIKKGTEPQHEPNQKKDTCVCGEGGGGFEGRGPFEGLFLLGNQKGKSTILGGL